MKKTKKMTTTMMKIMTTIMIATKKTKTKLTEKSASRGADFL